MVGVYRDPTIDHHIVMCDYHTVIPMADLRKLDRLELFDFEAHRIRKSLNLRATKNICIKKQYHVRYDFISYFSYCFVLSSVFCLFVFFVNFLSTRGPVGHVCQICHRITSTINYSLVGIEVNELFEMRDEITYESPSSTILRFFINYFNVVSIVSSTSNYYLVVVVWSI